jgi:tetratricopeptide (TPR) repeat protein
LPARAKSDLLRFSESFPDRLQQGHRLDPKFADAYANRGIGYANMKDYDRAITDYSKAIELDPKYVWAYNHRGFAYVNKQDYDCAMNRSGFAGGSNS